MAALAPIVLFCYNRPRHTEQTLTALSQNLLADQSELFVFCDGPKPDADEAQKHKIEEVRRIVKSKNWCGKVTVFESALNKGLANSIIEGVTRIVNQYGRIIVLEDDLIASKYFLEYMNTALEKYKDEEKVMVISGYQFPEIKWVTTCDAFFLPFSTSWGWATFKRAWSSFDPNASGFHKLVEDADLRRRFDMDDSYPYSKMLENQMAHKKVDSWAIRWWWTIFSKEGLALFPAKSLVRNIGFDSEATHTTGRDFESHAEISEVQVRNLPEDVTYDSRNVKLLCDWLRSSQIKPVVTVKKAGHQNSFFRKILNLVYRFDS